MRLRSGSIDILLRFRCGSKHEVRSCGLESASGFSIDRRNFRPSEPKQGGKFRERHFPPNIPYSSCSGVFWGGEVNNFPSWLASTGGKKFPLGDACHVPQSEEHHRKDPIQIQNPCVSIILRPLITALPALLRSPVTAYRTSERYACPHQHTMRLISRKRIWISKEGHTRVTRHDRSRHDGDGARAILLSSNGAASD